MQRLKAERQVKDWEDTAGNGQYAERVVRHDLGGG